MRRVSSGWVTFDALGFDVLEHLIHIFCSSVYSDFLDLALTLALCPGLICLKGFEDRHALLPFWAEDVLPNLLFGEEHFALEGPVQIIVVLEFLHLYNIINFIY